MLLASTRQVPCRSVLGTTHESSTPKRPLRSSQLHGAPLRGLLPPGSTDSPARSGVDCSRAHQ